MIIPNIEILSSNLANYAVIEKSNNTLTLTFESSITFNKILIKDTNITNLNLSYKSNAEDISFTPIVASKSNYQNDYIFSLVLPLEVQVLKVEFVCQDIANYKQFLVLESKVILNDVLSDIDVSVYSKSGYHYLSNGTLIKWSDFSKNAITLTLQNIPYSTKQILSNLLKENTFLTYIFFGSYDTELSSVYALTEPAIFKLNRKTGYYNVSLNLREQ